jgi:hypothetical protein
MITFLSIIELSWKFIMKRKLTAGLAISLVLFVVLGGISFSAMMLCVHGGDGHERQTIHFHFGQLEGQSCGESRTGLCHTTHEEGPRHFSLGLETLINSQTSFKRVLSMLPYAQLQSLASTVAPPSTTHCGYPFYDPSFVFPDTAWFNTTILII